MKSIYLVVGITYFVDGPQCFIHQLVDGEWYEASDIPIEKAYRLMWELVKAGGTREYKANNYDHSLHSVRTTLWMGYFPGE